MSARKRILISCSAKGGIPYYWFESYDKIMRMPAHPEFDFEFVLEDGNNAINLTRNIVAQHAIDGDYWKLVQIDRDQFWQPEQLIRLVSHNEPIVAAPYCKKKIGPVSWLMVSTPGAVLREDGLLQCDFMGTGIFSTEVAALRVMVQAFPELRFAYDDEAGTTKEMTELFPIGLAGPNTVASRYARIKKIVTSGCNDADAVTRIIAVMNETVAGSNRLLGEDYFFCLLARKAGFKLYCDTQNVIGHVGDIIYPLGEHAKSLPAGIPSHSLNLDQF